MQYKVVCKDIVLSHKEREAVEGIAKNFIKKPMNKNLGMMKVELQPHLTGKNSAFEFTLTCGKSKFTANAPDLEPALQKALQKMEGSIKAL